jgi:hypothetical protein
MAIVVWLHCSKSATGYLVGSRSLGLGDDLSDWDTIIFTVNDQIDEGSFSDGLDEAFGVIRPMLQNVVNLDFHIETRRARGVDITILGPEARRERERLFPAEWVYQLRHAIEINEGTGITKSYIARVMKEFEAKSPELAQRAYKGFRESRNEAVSILPRADFATQALTASSCVAYAARFWLLAMKEPLPTEKWILQRLSRFDDTTELLSIMRIAVDLRQTASSRFDAPWRLWALVDRHARSFGISTQ